MEENNNSRAFISINEWLDKNRRFNFNVAALLLSFSTMLFHFATVFFFTFQLKSLALVWIFLGLWNFFAFLIDIPLSILQNHFKAKTLLWISAISQIWAILIFANFIFWVTNFLAQETTDITVIKFFLWDWLNWFLLLFASVLYWFNKELNDITLISYILSEANPSQYKSILAQKNLFIWIWSMLWLISSWIILSFSPKLILIALIILLVSIAYISINSFDSKEKSINLANIKNFKVYFSKGWINKLQNDLKVWVNDKKENLVKNVSNIELKQVLWNTKYIFIKPLELKKQMPNISELVKNTKEEFIKIYETLKFANKWYLIVYWSFYMLLIFWFWDTFASTFLIDFLDKVKSWWSFILLWIIAIPAFWLQDYFWKLSDKIWVYKIANIGLAISWISLILMTFFSFGTLNFYIILGLALANSIWYAICMSLSVSVFLEEYNKTYAIKNELKEIDWNASAAPMKILQNLANVIWLVFGWIILWIAWYTWFFFLFGWLIMYLLYWSIKVKEKIITK